MKPIIPLAALALAAGLTPGAAAQQPLSPADSARHVLNRLGYGPTPGKVDEVAHAGVLAWVDRELVRAPVDAPGNRPALVVPTRTLVQWHVAQVSRAVTAAPVRADSMAATPRPPSRRPDPPPGQRDLRQVNSDLAALTVSRAVSGESQVREVLADFWLNHFNVLVNKGFVRAYFRDYLEQTIRAHALGTFGDLLAATAHSPAMLFYLDNVQSVAEGADATAMRRPRQVRNPAVMERMAARAPRGLNENYARELLELHTLGVDGGYTQADVIGVARILTGWTLSRGAGEPGFTFDVRVHDRGPKTVLGVTFAGGGIEEGERLLRLLADHPATMHHVSRKLCARLVADAAPDGCIDDAVRAWKQSGGDIRTIVRAIVHSPDFWAPVNVGAKAKTPLEFVVSAIRAVGGTADDTPRVAAQVGRLGQPLFQQTAPTGYPESLADWMNSGALLARMNFAIALASGRAPGVVADLDALIPPSPDHPAMVSMIDRVILGGAMSPRTRETIIRELADIVDPRAARNLAVGLAIGGPEFQRQ